MARLVGLIVLFFVSHINLIALEVYSFVVKDCDKKTGIILNVNEDTISVLDTWG